MVGGFRLSAAATPLCVILYIDGFTHYFSDEFIYSLRAELLYKSREYIQSCTNRDTNSTSYKFDCMYSFIIELSDTTVRELNRVYFRISKVFFSNFTLSHHMNTSFYL